MAARRGELLDLPVVPSVASHLTPYCLTASLGLFSLLVLAGLGKDAAQRVVGRRQRTPRKAILRKLRPGCQLGQMLSARLQQVAELARGVRIVRAGAALKANLPESKPQELQEDSVVRRLVQY